MSEETLRDKAQTCPRCRGVPGLTAGLGRLAIWCQTVACPVARDPDQLQYYKTVDEAMDAWNGHALLLWIRRPLDRAMVKAGLRQWKKDTPIAERGGA